MPKSGLISAREIVWNVSDAELYYEALKVTYQADRDINDECNSRIYFSGFDAYF